MHELADTIVLSRSNLTRLVDRLEAKGLLYRKSCPNDRRGAYAVLTPEGLEMQQRMWPVYEGQLPNTSAVTLMIRKSRLWLRS
jgi:DNA-binding MarR family transcriptional regulator